MATESTRRVATYERVSSEDQRERQTIRTQTEVLARELERNPEVELVRRYADDGVSGTIPMIERPDGRRLLQDAERGVFDELWVYDLTRLARNTTDATQIRDTLERWDVVLCTDGRAVEPSSTTYTLPSPRRSGVESASARSTGRTAQRPKDAMSAGSSPSATESRASDRKHAWCRTSRRSGVTGLRPRW